MDYIIPVNCNKIWNDNSIYEAYDWMKPKIGSHAGRSSPFFDAPVLFLTKKDWSDLHGCQFLASIFPPDLSFQLILQFTALYKRVVIFKPLKVDLSKT